MATIPAVAEEVMVVEAEEVTKEAVISQTIILPALPVEIPTLDPTIKAAVAVVAGQVVNKPRAANLLPKAAVDGVPAMQKSKRTKEVPGNDYQLLSCKVDCTMIFAICLNNYCLAITKKIFYY